MWRTLPPGFKQSSVDIIVLWEQLVYSVMEKINISRFVLFPNWYCKNQNSEFELFLQKQSAPLS